MSKKLAPLKCKCGHDAKVYTHDGGDYYPDQYYVACTECGWQGDCKDTPEEATEDWNLVMNPKGTK